jgi:hypothetical protein
MAARSPSSTAVSPRERAHLERAHQELRTALTTLRSNVDLIRIRLDDGHGDPVAVAAHLMEVDSAVDRLVDLAQELKGWHSGRVP